MFHMDYALSFSQVLTSSTRPKMMIISARSSMTKPEFFIRKNLCPSISKISNVAFSGGTSKLLGSPQFGHHALVSPLVHAQHDGKGDGGDGKTTRKIISSEPAATLGASFVLACALGIFFFGSMLVASPRTAVANAPSSTTGDVIYTRSGYQVIHEFMADVVFLGTPTTVPRLKERALMKMKEGMSHEEVLKQMKIAAMSLDTGPAEQYDLEMALVEILILQGKYEEALKYKCLDETMENPRSDLIRRSFYRAIIHTELKNKNEAYDAWKLFCCKGFDKGFPDFSTNDAK